MAPMMVAVPDDQAIENIVAYLLTLPSEPAPITITGDLKEGEELYGTCVACHGENGQGIWALNAPGLAGMTDWYLVRQLQNFRDGIRGSHPEDAYGDQMRMMADIFANDQAINDVVAYLNTL